MAERINLSGKRFGRWTVLEYVGQMKWLCRCDCGTEKPVNGSSLRREITGGCIKCNPALGNRLTHGGSHSRLYRCWEAMKYRCLKPGATAYHRYGARGITVCQEWTDSFELFRDWALVNGYTDHLTIERNKNDLGYSPDNCRWATYAEQNRNTSRTRLVTYQGRRAVAADLAIERGMPPDVVRQRIHRYGWPVELALSTPVAFRKHR